MKRRTLKNVWAVLAGFVIVFALSVLTDGLMMLIGVFPGMDNPELYTDWMYLLSLTYCSFYTFLGGYFTAKQSSGNTMFQVYVLAILGLISGTFGAYVNWDRGTGHEWFPIALALTGPLFVIWGGKMFVKKQEKLQVN
jgi:H+/Cl- antiporter ClcA